MNIVVINIVSLNPGDAAILQGSIEVLRRAFGDNLDITVFDRNGDAAARYYPWARFRPSLFDVLRHGRLGEMASRRGWAHRLYRMDALRFRAAASLLQRGLDRLAAVFVSDDVLDALRAYLKADLIISNGGTYLVPHYNLLRPILDCELALSLDRPLVFFPQSLGPFDSTRFRPRLKRIFSLAGRVVGRDARSADHLRELGVPEDRIMVGADAAFALALDEPARRVSPEQPRVAISVREWAYFRNGDPATMQARYESAIAALVTRLVRRHGARITFISTCQGIPEYWTDDSVCAQTIADGLELDVAAHVHVDTAFREPIDLMHELAAYDVVVATRMHVAILALDAGVPVLPIAYEFKTRELFRAMGLEEWVTDIEEMDEAAFVARAERMLAALNDIQARTAAGVAERRQTTLRLADTLGALIARPG
jgi:colanic acid/amylovoran biosynthesis protein